jgi:pyridoxal phosphate enzyme (YggS family)
VTIAERFAEVAGRIAAACERAGRDPSEVKLVSVAKTFSADRVREALAAGAVAIGENRAQELKEKAATLGGDIEWHFVGHLQTNKVRQVVGVAALIHSVDRYGLAEAIARRARSLDLIQDVLIEVNIAGEAAKGGVEPGQVAAFAAAAAALEGVRVTGLMTMAPFADDPDASRPFFRDLAELGTVVRAELPGATALSMGMTRDFEVAIEEGATLVRVGEAIFGPRTR